MHLEIQETENDTVGLTVIVGMKGCRYYTQSVWKKVSSWCKLTLQCGASSTARPRENFTCRGATSAARLLHCLTHSTISRQHREKT